MAVSTSNGDERTPLLSSHIPDLQDGNMDIATQRINLRHTKRGQRSHGWILTLLTLAILNFGIGDELQSPAQTRVFESIYCRQYYKEHDHALVGSDGGNGVAEKFCKNHVIQGEVAMLRGWQNTIEAFVMLLVGVPWGYAADTWGRKPVLLLLMVGLWLRAAWIQVVCWFWWILPIEAVWFSALADLLGGGAAITIAIVFTIITDVLPQNERASMFFIVAGVSIATQIVGALGSACLMRINPWVPLFLGLAIQSFTVVFALVLPETKDYQIEGKIAPEEEDFTATSPLGPAEATLGKTFKQALKDLTAFLAADLRLLLLVPAFFLHMLIANGDILLQYISTRYGLSLADATFVITFRSSFILGLMLLLYPALNHVLRKRLNWHPQRADLIVSRFCAVALALGFFSMALAPSLPLMIAAMAVNTLGAGLHLYLRSLATSFVEPHHVARLMTFVSWVDTGGLMVASPLVAWLFERGVDNGGMWMGLPFFFTSGVFVVVSVLIGMISLGRRTSGQEVEPLMDIVDEESINESQI